MQVIILNLKSITDAVFIFCRNGGLVDATPETERELKSELERIAKQFGGGGGVDMTKFPEFKFDEPLLDPINASSDK